MIEISTDEPRIGLITGAPWPELWHDDWLLRDALRARGALVEPVIWSRAGAPPSRERYDLLALRSCWDYADALPEFLRWPPIRFSALAAFRCRWTSAQGPTARCNFR